MVDIVGIGSPLLDSTITVDKEFLKEHNLVHGGMTLINDEQHNLLLEIIDADHVQSTPGGSLANVLAAASKVGSSTLFIGSIGNDEFGETYELLITEQGVSSALIKANCDQGQCLVFVTPDGERTFATYLGASLEIDSGLLDLEAIKEAKVLHIEGYQFDGEKNTAAVLQAMKVAKEHNVLISLDVADPGIIERHKELMDKVIPEFVDIIFANEAEAKAFTGLEELAAANELAKICKIAVVKIGERGSIIVADGQTHNIKGFKVDVVNTNGAGDTFAGVFLSQYLTGKTIIEAGELASYAAAQVVAQEAAQLRVDVRQQNL